MHSSSTALIHDKILMTGACDCCAFAAGAKNNLCPLEWQGSLYRERGDLRYESGASLVTVDHRSNIPKLFTAEMFTADDAEDAEKTEIIVIVLRVDRS